MDAKIRYYHSFIRGRTFKEWVFNEIFSLDWLKVILDALNAVFVHLPSFGGVMQSSENCAAISWSQIIDQL